MSDSPGLVDFAVGLVKTVFNLPDGQVMFFENSKNRRSVKSILLDEKLLGLVEMTSGLVNASCTLPKWQAVKMIFFAPYIYKVIFYENQSVTSFFPEVEISLTKLGKYSMISTQR